MNKRKTIEITLTALLTAIAVFIPLFMPIKVVMPPFTATLASHAPLMVAMFISPFSAVFVSCASALAFLPSFGPIVMVRAFMHIFFVWVGAVMIRKNRNIYLVLIVTLILHTLSDMLTVYVIASIAGFAEVLKGQAMSFVQYIIGVGTSVHHIVDFAVALLVYVPLRKVSGSLSLPAVNYKFK